MIRSLTEISDLAATNVAKQQPESISASTAKSPANQDAAVLELSKQKPNNVNSQTQELTEEEKREVEYLKERDREVRAHEQAHLAALGAYRSGGASYTFETGPDGKQYAVAGEVPVDVSPEEEPQKTIEKAQTIQRAALAPAEPSGADRSVAAQAAQLEAQARAELAEQKREEQSISAETDSSESQDSERTGALSLDSDVGNTLVDGTIGKFTSGQESCPVCGEKLEAGHSHIEASA